MVEQTKKGRKVEQQLQTTRICVLGPSFVGKTQIVNRLVNNDFYPQYYPTEELEVYKLLQNRAFLGGQDYCQIEILDCFPQDHPNLFKDPSKDENEEARVMIDTLQRIVENKPEDGKRWIDAYIFVYDSGNRQSFHKLLKVIKSVHEFERSHNLGKKDDTDDKVYKYVLGTKKDLKEHKRVLTDDDMEKLYAYNEDLSISLQEVSALTSYGVDEVFRSILQEVVGKDATGASTDQPNTQDEVDYGDEDDETEDMYEESKDNTPTAGGVGVGTNKRAFLADPAEQQTDFMQQEKRKLDIEKKKARKGAAEEESSANTGAGLSNAQKPSRQKTKQGEDSSDMKSLFKSVMPFLFQEETDKGGRTRK